MSTKGTPIITCGDKARDATAVNPLMKPEYDVLYSGYSLPETLHELPLILSGKVPTPETLHSQIGPNDFTTRNPVAVSIGGGYSDDDFKKLFDACSEACGGHLPVVFLRADKELTKKLVAEGKGPTRDKPEYSAFVANRLKNRLQEIGIKANVEDGDVRSEMLGQVFMY